jgi:predicted GTPase
MKKVRAIHERAQNRVSTARLNKILTTAWVTNPPNFPKNRVCKIYY